MLLKHTCFQCKKVFECTDVEPSDHCCDALRIKTDTETLFMCCEPCMYDFIVESQESSQCYDHVYHETDPQDD